MDALTGGQRVSAAFKKTFSDQKPEMDRIPAYLITGQCNAQLIDVSIRDWLLDPKITYIIRIFTLMKVSTTRAISSEEFS